MLVGKSIALFCGWALFVTFVVRLYFPSIHLKPRVPVKTAEPPIFVNASKLSQKIRICSSAMSESSSTRRLTLKKESPTEPVTKRSASPGPSNASDVKRQNDKIHSPLKVPPAKETENVSSAELLAVLH